MNPEKQRAAIAQAFDIPEIDVDLNDLNKIHKAIDGLKWDWRLAEAYTEQLVRIVCKKPPSRLFILDLYQLQKADAPQRWEALLRTWHLWEEAAQPNASSAVQAC